MATRGRKHANTPKLATGVANGYADDNERIYDLTNGTDNGALVNVRTDTFGRIYLSVYRVTGSVTVTLPVGGRVELTESKAAPGLLSDSSGVVVDRALLARLRAELDTAQSTTPDDRHRERVCDLLVEVEQLTGGASDGWR